MMARAGFRSPSSSILLILLQDGREHFVTMVEESLLIIILLVIIGLWGANLYGRNSNGIQDLRVRNPNQNPPSV